MSVAEPNAHNALVPRAAYVEDAPPAVPSPPPAVPAQSAESVNVFDFLVADETPNASRTSLGGTREPMTMKKGAPPIFSDRKDEQPRSRSGYKNREEQEHSKDYEEQGFSYGTEPVKPLPYSKTNSSLVSLEFMTPSARATRANLNRLERPTHSRTNSGNTSDKKRKRGSIDEQRYELEGDTLMADATPIARPLDANNTATLSHSGLTGGLNRLMSRPDPFPPSPDYSDHDRRVDSHSRTSRKMEGPGSPLKRSRHSKDDSGLGISIKGRAGRVMSMVGGGAVTSALAALTNPAGAQNGTNQSHHHGSGNGTGRELALVRSDRRRESWSDESCDKSRQRESKSRAAGGERERKKHRVHSRAHGSSSARYERSHRRDGRVGRRGGSNGTSPEAQRRKMKAIEYHDSSAVSESEDQRGTRNGNGQIVVYGHQHTEGTRPTALSQARAESFLAVVTKGPDSEKGYSINKALKRWHRDGGWGTGSEGKAEEEKELWRNLRLKRNERGEVVIFF